MSLSGVGIQTRPRGRITIMTSWVGKAQVYYSILGPQLASAPARLAGFFIPVLEGLFSECGRKRGEKHVIKGRKHMQERRVQGKQVVPSCFARLAAAAALSPQTCRGDLQINRKIGSAAGQPPFHLWLCVRALPGSRLSRFGRKRVGCHFGTNKVQTEDVAIHNVVNVSISSP